MLMEAVTPAAAVGAMRGCPIRCSSIIPPRWHSRSIITPIRAPLSLAQGVSRLIRPIGKAASALGTSIAPIGATARTWCAATTDRRALSEGSTHQAELAGPDIERQHRSVRDVETLDLTGHIEPRHDAAGLARQLPQALAFGAEHERQRLPQGHRAKILAALAVGGGGREAR